MKELKREEWKDKELERGDIVNIIDEEDELIIDKEKRIMKDMVMIEKIVGLVIDEDGVGIIKSGIESIGEKENGIEKNVGNIEKEDIRERNEGNIEVRDGEGIGKINIDLIVVNIEIEKIIEEDVKGGGDGSIEKERVKKKLIGVEMRIGIKVIEEILKKKSDGDIEKIEDDMIKIEEEIEKLGKFGGIKIEEGREWKIGKKERDLSFEKEGRKDNKDIIRNEILENMKLKMMEEKEIEKRNGKREIGVIMEDDEEVKIRKDLKGRKIDNLL